MLNAIYKTNNSDEIIKLLLNDVKNNNLTLNYIYNKYIPFLWQEKSSLFSVRNRYTIVRKEIEQLRLSKNRKAELLNLFTLSKELYSYLNSTSDEKAKEKLNEKFIFNKDSYIKELQRIRQLIEEKNLDSIRINRQNDNYILANLSAIFIVMNTGRRLFEIAKTLEISKSGKTIYYHNLIKKRDKKDKKFKAFLIDNDYKFLKKCLNYVRKYYENTFKNMTSKQFNSNYQKTFNKYIKQVLNYENISYAKTRDMYSDVAIAIYKTDNMDEELLREQVLSHEIQPLKTTDRYKKTKAI